VWFARTESEMSALAAYCEDMKHRRATRPPNRPYDTVVVQRATSTYLPPPPSYVAACHDIQRVCAAAPCVVIDEVPHVFYEENDDEQD